jgi:thiol:disulfide interchange protein DsbA
MHRRSFVTHTGALAVGATLVPPGLALAQAGVPRAGADFLVLNRPVPVDAPADKVEVIEFFGYFCPHCNAFEPVLSAWIKQLPADVVFKRVPVAFTASAAPQQRLYYALEAMGLVEQLHARVFAAIHVERLNLSQVAAITDWVINQGVDRASFTEHFNSFSVTTQATRARQLLTAYQVDGVPALGIAGRYYTDGALARSMDRVLQVVDYLTDQVRRAR